MNDERIEQLVRDWLAAQADEMEVPARLRSAAAAARPVAGSRRTLRSWFSWPRSGALVAVVAVVVLATIISITLSGVLPLGRPDGSNATIEAVRATVEEVPGYTWRMTGTELLRRLVSVDQNNAPVFEYAPVPVELAGVYEAPDAWRVEIIQGSDYDPKFVPGPSIGFFAFGEFDGYLMVDGRAWVRPHGATEYQPYLPEDPEHDALMFLRDPNQLSGLLGGIDFPMKPPASAQSEIDLRWTVVQDGDECRLSAVMANYVPAPGVVFTREVVVDPRTLLPSRAETAYARPETTPDAQGTRGSRNDTRLTFTYEYTDVPHLQPPSTATSLDTTRIRRDAMVAGDGGEKVN